MLYFGLLAAFVLEYIRPSTYLPAIAALRLNSIVPVAVFLSSLIFAQCLNGTKTVLQHRNSRWLGAFLFLLAIAPLHADVTLYTFDAFKAVLGYLFMAFAVAKLVDGKKKYMGLIVTLVLCHIALVALNPQIITNPEQRHYIAGVTFLGDGNDFALSVCILIPLGIYLFLEAEVKWHRLVLAAMVAIMILSVIGTSSRGAALALIAAALYLWWHSRRRVLGMFVIAMVSVGVLSFASDLFIQRMETLQNYEEEGSAMGRIKAWKSAIRMANDNPLLGVGSAHFGVKFGTEYRPPDVDGPMPWHNAHSIYFMMLGEFGYPGIVILLGSLVACYRSGARILKVVRESKSAVARRYERMYLCLNSSLVAFAIGAAFLSALYYPHWYVIMGLYIAADLMYRRDEPNVLVETAEGSAQTQESVARFGG